ncbi:FkbM family methyltransferase [Elongatibacter sediminis]|uniref:FkbM family methyltransferase n=1 Tax=Elongatibacter sediminis TaxID=3119006 RepID=A0AAW9RJ64_9GAMM
MLNKLRSWVNPPPKSTDSDYLRDSFLQHIPRERIDLIVELGSYDGHDAIMLRDYFDARVYTFECNPDILRQTRKNLRNKSGITLVEQAAWNENARIPFYPVTKTIRGNAPHFTRLAASSCYRASRNYLEINTQRETHVHAIRLDSWCHDHGIETIDLLCMDIQGAAFPALQGLGSVLDRVGYMIAEIERKEMYHGETLFPQINDYLGSHGLSLKEEICRDDWFSDFLFIREG